MLSQYFYLHPNNRWTNPCLQTTNPFHQLIKQKISSALSLSLNLFALNSQQNKLKQMQARVIFKSSGKSDNKTSRKSSETLDVSQKYMMSFQKEEEFVKQNKSQVNNEKTRKYSTLTNLTPILSQDISGGNAAQEDHTQQIVLLSKKVPRKIRHHFTKSYRKESKRPKIEQKLKKIKKVTLVSTADIKGQMLPLERYRKMIDLLERSVKSWNPSKQESYIKNRQFRMLIRNA